MAKNINRTRAVNIIKTWATHTRDYSDKCDEVGKKKNKNKYNIVQIP